LAHTAVNAGIHKLSKRRKALRRSKKDLLTLIEDVYPAELKDVARLLYTKPITQVQESRF
jgi:hypothetical protein